MLSQLIDFEKGKLTLSQEGTKILTSLDKHANVNVVFVFGNARSGKSFMMNALTGVPGLFKGALTRRVLPPLDLTVFAFCCSGEQQRAVHARR